jgi:hypothetical protein
LHRRHERFVRNKNREGIWMPFEAGEELDAVLEGADYARQMGFGRRKSKREAFYSAIKKEPGYWDAGRGSGLQKMLNRLDGGIGTNYYFFKWRDTKFFAFGPQPPRR